MSTGSRAGVLFAVDAGPETGMGHLARSTALADALARSHVSCVFLTGNHPSVSEKVRAVGGRVAHLDTRGMDANPQTLARLAHEHCCAAIVIDSYRVGDRTRADLRDLGFVVAAIDDLARERFSCHLVVNGGPQATALRYEASTLDTIFLLGPQYALLRSEFWSPLPPREPRLSVRNVVVSLGAGASASLIGDVLRGLDAVAHDFEITVIRGPFTAAQDWQVPSTASRHPLRVLADPPFVREAMRDADLAICGGGQTLLELAAVGTPAVALRLADNQADSLAAVVRAGAARFAGPDGAPDIGREISTAVQELCARADLRAAMSEAGPRLVDGGGAIRVARVLLDVLAAQPKLGRASA